MEEQKIYLALVNNNFVLTQEIYDYFLSEDIIVLKHLDSLGILKLKSKKDLDADLLRFVSHIELDEIVNTQEEE